MAKIYEDYFTDLQADMVSICLEYVNNRAEFIYIYGSIENKTISFNVFYQINKRVVRLNEVNEALSTNEPLYDASIDRQFGVLQIGTEDLEKIIDLCKEYKQKVPTEIKLYYNVQKNSLDAKYKYDKVYSNKEKSASDVFNEWYTEIKKEEPKE